MLWRFHETNFPLSRLLGGVGGVDCLDTREHEHEAEAACGGARDMVDSGLVVAVEGHMATS